MSEQSEMVEILKRIEAEAKKTNERLAALETRAEATNRSVDGLHQDNLAVIERLDVLHEDALMDQASQTAILAELRGLRGEAIEDQKKIVARLVRLEEAVFPPPGRPARRAGATR